MITLWNPLRASVVTYILLQAYPGKVTTMTAYSMRNLVLLLVVISCILSITSGRHHSKLTHHRKFYRRSPNDSDKLKIVVNRTVINITTTSSNGESSHDPVLKSVNTILEDPKHGNTHVDSGIDKSSIPHHDHNMQPSENVDPSSTNSDHKLLDTEVFKTLLRELVTRLDKYETQKQTFPSPVTAAENPLHSIPGGEEHRHINSLNARHCVLHGLWLSTVAGTAIELIPIQQQGHIEIRTRIFELPDNPFPPLINSQWTGKGIISQESPTTLTIVFQEHIDAAKENHAKERGLERDGDNDDDSSVVIQLPRTAVFVGQCLVCQGNPTLQGAWVVFPASQTCTAGEGFVSGNNNGVETLAQQKHDSIRLTTPDAIYLLRYF